MVKRLLSVQVFWDDTTDSGGNCRAGPNGTKLVLSEAKSEAGLALALHNGDTLTDIASSKTPTCLQNILGV
jgi:hypothetical protein